MFEYDGDNPFHIYNIPHYPLSSDELLFNHWHEELEIVYTLQGNSLHYIDGTCIKSQPGRLIVVNSESSHNIIPDHGIWKWKKSGDCTAYFTGISGGHISGF